MLRFFLLLYAVSGLYAASNIFESAESINKEQSSARLLPSQENDGQRTVLDIWSLQGSHQSLTVSMDKITCDPCNIFVYRNRDSVARVMITRKESDGRELLQLTFCHPQDISQQYDHFYFTTNSENVQKTQAPDVQRLWIQNQVQILYNLPATEKKSETNYRICIKTDLDDLTIFTIACIADHPPLRMLLLSYNKDSLVPIKH